MKSEKAINTETKWERKTKIDFIIILNAVVGFICYETPCVKYNIKNEARKSGMKKEKKILKRGECGGLTISFLRSQIK